MERIRYAPMDWIYSRPHGRLVQEMARDALKPPASYDQAVAAATSMKIAPYMKHMGDTVGALFRYSVDQMGIEAAPRSDMDIRWEGQLHTAIMAWETWGRQVFRFDREMTESMRNIDFGEAKVGDISHPYQSYYLVFDEEKTILPNGETLDGIQVISAMMPPNGDRIAMTQAIIERLMTDGTPEHLIMEKAKKELNTVPVLTLIMHPRGYAEWPGRRVHGYAYELELTQPERPLREALIESIARFAEESGDNAQFQPIPDLTAWIDLAMNAALYLTRYAGDVKTSWQSEAPVNLVEGADAGRRSPQRELARLGYAPTRFIRFGGGEDDDAVDGDGRAVKAHWRRGHWRNQPYGQGQSMRKLVLVRPTRVGWKAASPDPTRGPRTYEVKAQT